MNKILTKVGLIALNRNFGGLEKNNTKIQQIFKLLFYDNYDETVSIKEGTTVFQAIKENVSDPNSRYLMLISEGNDASDIAKYILGKLNKKFLS